MFVLLAANVFDPGGAFGLRYVAFALGTLCAFWALRLFYLPTRVLILGLLLFVVWPTWSLLYGAARGGDVFIGVVQVAPFVFVVIVALILPALDHRTPLRMFYGCLFFLGLTVSAAFLVIVFLPDKAVSQRLLEFLIGLNDREGYFRTVGLGDLEVPWIYFRSTLFLVPAFVYYLFVNKFVRAGVVLLALGLTLSKAGLTIAFLFGAYYSVSVLLTVSPAGREGGRKHSLAWMLRRFVPITVVAAVVVALLWSLPALSGEIRDSWQGQSDSSQVRIGHFHSVMNLFLEHPSYLVVGQGAGVPFYSLGEFDYVQNIEIDHLNAIRKFGLPWFLAFTAVVFYSARGLIKSGDVEGKAFGFALVSIYFAAGTNPVLTSDLFIILMTLSYSAWKGFVGPSRSGAHSVSRPRGVGPVSLTGGHTLGYGSGVADGPG